MICTRCGTMSDGPPALRGSGWIELVLWLSMLVPGIIYSIWRRQAPTPICPACGSRDLVDVSTPVGRKLQEQHHPGAPPRTLRPILPPAPPPRGLLHGLLRGAAVALGCVLAVGLGLILFA